MIHKAVDRRQGVIETTSPMALKRLISVILCLWPLLSFAAKDQAPFRFHLFVESHGVDPQLTNSASGNYVLHLLYRGLYVYHSRQGLKPVGAKECTWDSPLKLTCHLNPQMRWSTGARIEASDYLKSFRRLVDPKIASPQSGVLSGLKNAGAIASGKMAPDQLGVRAVDGDTLVFDFAQPDPEFLYKLIHPALTPFPPGGYPPVAKAETVVTSGPYRIQQWKSGAWIRFTPNPYFPSKAHRPPAEAYFVDDDTTALRMYETGRLDFLRRLTAREIPRFKGKPGFYQIPMARFDYLGFGPELESSPDLRSALIHGVDFATFMKMFETLSPPGCPSMPAKYMDKVYCQKPDFALAKKANSERSLDFYFSRMGGEDIAREAEWFQGQWRKNTKLKVELHSEEQSLYLAKLKVKAPMIFRKGVTLDRPTCLAGLEIFQRDNPENYLRFNDPEYERLLVNLTQAKDESERKQACRLAVERLLNSNRLIPLGEMFFTILAKPSFRGWDLNELNQLDLSELQAVHL
jgi:oligopeptide transport system substrate-binding protein